MHRFCLTDCTPIVHLPRRIVNPIEQFLFKKLHKVH
nr:MAG TPA: hypothetical protein [Caudoviricetes sp.]